MRIILFLVAIACSFWSCNEDNDILVPVRMADGTVINVDKGTNYYGSYEDFVHHVDFNFKRIYNVNAIEKFNYDFGKTYEINGISQCFIGKWEIAKFGDWIKEFGFLPNQNYYVATIVYAKYVSAPLQGFQIVPKIGIKNMGYIPDYPYATFEVIVDRDLDACILITGVRYIGYDQDKEKINTQIPSLINNQLTWKFSIQKDGWD